MYNIYISGDTYSLREEIKRLKPTNKHFKRWWRYDYKFNCWHLKVADTFFTKEFNTLIVNFSQKHSLILEVLQEPKPVKKSINDFESEEEYFEHFHKKNKPNGFIPK